MSLKLLVEVLLTDLTAQLFSKCAVSVTNCGRLCVAYHRNANFAIQGVRALLTRGLSYNNYRIIMLDSIAFLVSPVLTNLTSQLVCQRFLY